MLICGKKAQVISNHNQKIFTSRSCSDRMDQGPPSSGGKFHEHVQKEQEVDLQNPMTVASVGI